MVSSRFTFHVSRRFDRVDFGRGVRPFAAQFLPHPHREEPLGQLGIRHGFFVSPAGYALTAYHNLPADVEANGSGTVEVFYGSAMQRLLLNFRADLSDRASDVAVLQLPDADAVDFTHVPLAVLSQKVEEPERKAFWRHQSRLFMFGFPVRQGSERTALLPDHLIQGSVAPQVMRNVVENDQQGNPTENVTRLFIIGDLVSELGGISGGAVLDARTGWAVGVEGSYFPDSGEVLASELAGVVEKWEEVGEAAQLPVFLPLRLWETTAGHAPRETLKRFVCAQARELEKVFDEYFEAGRFLFLCDALNEMAEYRADSPQVRLLTEWIKQFGEREGEAPAEPAGSTEPAGSAGASPSRCRFFFSCCTENYQVSLPARRVDVARLEDDDIGAMARRYLTACGRADDTPAFLDELRRLGCGNCARTPCNSACSAPSAPATAPCRATSANCSALCATCSLRFRGRKTPTSLRCNRR
jgi:hypothetical protein